MTDCNRAALDVLSARVRVVLLLVATWGQGCRSLPAGPVAIESLRVGAPVDFGRIWVGFPAAIEFEVVNPNPVTVALQWSTSEPFTVLEGQPSVAAGASSVARIGFHPSDAGLFAADLVINEVPVRLTGEGVFPFDCAPATACTTVAFSPDAGTCLSAPRPDGTDCTSTNACFNAARCERGECVGTLTTCDDHDACTLDVCGQEGCAHLDALPRCRQPVAPCQVASCDRDAGCGNTPAPDGTSCGASDCSTAQVCIGGSCVTRPVPQDQPCSVAACVDAGVGCGVLQLNGAVVRCGGCSAGQVCDATTHACTTPATSCTANGVACGTTVDACGLPVPCPDTCPANCLGTTCGSRCLPVTCAHHGAQCGITGDGCGAILCCGDCTAAYRCGAVTPNRCDVLPSGDGGACVPRTCATLGATCGSPSDGCGGTLSCGTCTAPEECGGAGTYRCGSPLEAECGPIGVAGQIFACGGCPPGMTCGGGGAPYRCGVGACQPLSCVQQNVNSGPAGDGCGGLLQCGSGGTPVPLAWCTTPLYRRCAPKPLACRQLGFDCGVAQSACGPSIDCGTCLAPQTCQSNRCR